MIAVKSRLMVIGLVAVLGLVAAACSADDDATQPDTSAPGIAAACVEGVPDCNDTPLDLPPDLPKSTSGDEPIDGPSVVRAIGDASEYDGAGRVALSGYFVDDGETARFCEVLAESYPPQCGGASLVLTNPDAVKGFLLVEEGQVQWSDDAIVLTGEVAGEDFTVATE